MDIVNERIDTVKETAMKLPRNLLQRSSRTFEEKVPEEVPEDVSQLGLTNLQLDSLMKN